MKSNENPGKVESALEAVPQEFLVLAGGVKGTYAVVEPAAEFRSALRTRLVAEATRLQEEPAPASRGGLVARAALGAAAVSVAGLALVAWRTRAIPNLVAHAQDQLRSAHGS